MTKTALPNNMGYLLGFTLSIAGLSLVLSWLCLPWVRLSWWMTFRRMVSISAGTMLLIFMWRVHKQSLRTLGFGSWREGKRRLLQGVLLGFGAVLAIGGVYLATGACQMTIPANQLRALRVVGGFFPIAIMIAVLEELIFRGYVLQKLLAYSTALGVTGSSAAYALVHLRPPFEWPGSAMQLTGLFILGCVLAWSYLRSRQLYLAVGLHAGFAYFAVANKLIVAFTAPSSIRWLVGTSRLVDGVVGWVMLGGLAWSLSHWVKLDVPRPLFRSSDAERPDGVPQAALASAPQSPS